MKKEVLYYKDITYVRQGQSILKGVNWEVKEGENWALLGANGSGKSTILSMIPAYNHATRGELRVFGKRFGSCVWENIKNKIGFVSSTLNEFSSTLNRQTVKDIVISGKFSSIGIYKEVEKEVEEKAEKLVKDFKLEYLGDKRYGTFSQGEQRRALLARALMNNPELLIFDEPCSGLDVPSREYFLSALEERAKTTDISYIYVTHQIEEILPSITHVALLKDGKVMAQGSKKEVLTEELLSRLFEIDVRIEWENDRPWLIVKK